jgi:hypothetical protein
MADKFAAQARADTLTLVFSGNALSKIRVAPTIWFFPTARTFTCPRKFSHRCDGAPLK